MTPSKSRPHHKARREDEIVLVLRGAQALRVMRLLAAEDEARPPKSSAGELRDALLEALPCPGGEIYKRAGIPRPWRGAGLVLRGMRQRGEIVLDRGGYYRRA